MASENNFHAPGTKYLEKALTKSQNCLNNTGSPESAMNAYKKIRTTQTEVSGRRSGDRYIKVNSGGLNLRSNLKNEMNSYEFDENPDDIAAECRGTARRSSIFRSDNLARRPLRDGLVNENEISAKEEDYEKCAVCKNCGGLSANFQYCERCTKLLPKNAKTYNRVIKQDGSKKGSANCTKNTYAKKIREQFYHVTSTSGSERKKPTVRQRRNNEPVCLTLSSDEEEQNSLAASDGCSDPRRVTSVIAYAGSKDLFQAPRAKAKRLLTETQINSQLVVEDTFFKCRSIRIGSFKYMSETPVTFSVDGISLEAMSINEIGTITIDIRPNDLAKIFFHFGHTLSVFFIYTSRGCTGSIRSRLNMSRNSGPFYDPFGIDDTEKRITLLPVKITDEQRFILRSILAEYGRIQKNPSLFEEIDNCKANDILVKSTPSHIRSVAKMFVSTRMGSKECIGNYMSPAMPTIKMMTYPPPPQTGGITITSDDYTCLEEGQFLNDVIIDFYLKYLVQNQLSEMDRKRTHIFSSFFYRCLTQRPTRKNAPVNDPPLPLAEVRHNRVKTWTRHVDIFEKDFIIIPINEHAHWFLAIICFPYLDGPMSMNEHNQREHSVLKLRGGNVDETMMDQDNDEDTMPGFGNDDRSEDCATPSSEASMTAQLSGAEDDNLDADDATDSNASVGNKTSNAFVQPCILIFDSLSGPNKARIVSTLRDYLRVEWKVKKKTFRQFDKTLMKGSSPKVPQQTNYSDCGVYLLQYVESFFEFPPPNFTMPFPDLRRWFTDEHVSQKRRQLQALIYSLMLDQHGRDLLSPEESDLDSDEIEKLGATESLESVNGTVDVASNS